jgi:hypothetical protein
MKAVMRIRTITVSLAAAASTAAHETNRLRFSFGTGQPAPGFTTVTATNLYSQVSGYGFEPGASVRALGTNLSQAFQDGTHHNNYGSYELAKCVAAGMAAAKLDLATFLVEDVRAFDPARPDPVEAFSVPPTRCAQLASPMATEAFPIMPRFDRCQRSADSDRIKLDLP